MSAPKADPFDLPPGFVKREGARASAGRWIDGDKVRFVNNRVQKIGGNERLTSSPFRGTCRGLHAWQDLHSHSLLGIGTTHKLYAASPSALIPVTNGGDTPPKNITPLRPSKPRADLTAAFSTTNASRIVTVAHVGHGLKPEQGLEFQNAPTVGGLDMTGQWEVATVPTHDTYTFVHTGTATSTAGPTGNALALYEIPPGNSDAVQGLGYGIGDYGMGPYGTARLTSNVWFDPYYWSIDNFGQVMIASPVGGRIYQWNPATHPFIRAEEVTGSPPVSSRFVFVTQERFVVALGCNPDATSAQDPLFLRWSSQGDYNLWIPDEDNTAGGRRLTHGKKLIGGGSIASGVSLVWTDAALYAHTYTGNKFVFDTRLVGTSCGLLGPMAFTFAKGQAFWVGSGAFHGYGGAVSKIPNQDDIAEWVFTQLRARFEIKTVCFYNERYDEVWWIFVPIGTNEPAIYVTVKLGGFHWVTGTMSRTAALRNDPTTADTRPVMAAGDGYLYIHETGVNDNAAAMRAWIQSGPVAFKNNTQVTGVMPEFAYQTGNVTVLFTATDRSDGSEIDRFQVVLKPNTGLEDLRMAGRQIDFKLTSNVVGGDFRFGQFTFETMGGGKRR